MTSCPMYFDCDTMYKKTPERGCVNYTRCIIDGDKLSPYYGWCFPINFSWQEYDGKKILVQTVMRDEPPFYKAERMRIVIKRDSCADIPYTEVVWNDIERGFQKPVLIPYERTATSLVVEARLLYSWANNSHFDELKKEFAVAEIIPPAHAAYIAATKARDYGHFRNMTWDLDFQYENRSDNDEDEDEDDE